MDFRSTLPLDGTESACTPAESSELHYALFELAPDGMIVSGTERGILFYRIIRENVAGVFGHAQARKEAEFEHAHTSVIGNSAAIRSMLRKHLVTIDGLQITNSLKGKGACS